MNTSLLEKLERICARLVSRIDADLQPPLVRVMTGQVWREDAQFSSAQHTDAQPTATDPIVTSGGVPASTLKVQRAPAQTEPEPRYPAAPDCVPAA